MVESNEKEAPSKRRRRRMGEGGIIETSTLVPFNQIEQNSITCRRSLPNCLADGWIPEDGSRERDLIEQIENNI